jgi:DNA-binding response OmpR family regulator
VSRILLIDDDASLLDVLALAFEEAGYDVRTAADGRAGLAASRARDVDVVITDVNMPLLDGFQLCRALRAERRHLPILLLTSRDSEIDEALGLELGADDYVAKPFRTRVLLARVAALLRREALRQGSAESRALPEAAEANGARAITRGALELDPDRIEVRYARVAIPVTVTEFRLLECLARRPGVVLSRDRLLELLRGDDSVVADRIIDTYVRRLRKKLQEVDAAFDRIETVIGAGYRWKSDRA